MQYRRKEVGEYKGGIMYLAKVLPQKLHFLGFAFAFFTIVASFGTGNLIQINTAVESFKNILPKDFLYTDTLAIIFAIILALLILVPLPGIDADFSDIFEDSEAYNLYSNKE